MSDVILTSNLPFDAFSILLLKENRIKKKRQILDFSIFQFLHSPNFRFPDFTTTFRFLDSSTSIFRYFNFSVSRFLEFWNFATFRFCSFQVFLTFRFFDFRIFGLLDFSIGNIDFAIKLRPPAHDE